MWEVHSTYCQSTRDDWLVSFPCRQQSQIHMSKSEERCRDYMEQRKDIGMHCYKNKVSAQTSLPCRGCSFPRQEKKCPIASRTRSSWHLSMLSIGSTLCSQKAVVDLIMLLFKSTRRGWKILSTRKKPPGSLVQVRNLSKMQNKIPTSAIATGIL